MRKTGRSPGGGPNLKSGLKDTRWGGGLLVTRNPLHAAGRGAVTQLLWHLSHSPVALGRMRWSGRQAQGAGACRPRRHEAAALGDHGMPPGVRMPPLAAVPGPELCSGGSIKARLGKGGRLRQVALRKAQQRGVVGVVHQAQQGRGGQVQLRVAAAPLGALLHHHQAVVAAGQELGPAPAAHPSAQWPRLASVWRSSVHTPPGLARSPQLQCGACMWGACREGPEHACECIIAGLTGSPSHDRLQLT